jgi:DNA-binding Lrp family transcriptional regulator
VEEIQLPPAIRSLVDQPLQESSSDASEHTHIFFGGKGQSVIVDMKDELDIKIREAYSVWGKLDELDVKILEALSIFGARNLSSIAEKIGVPTSTVRFRISRMISNSYLFIHARPYHTYLGLKKAFTFVKAKKGSEDVLLEAMRANDFWIFLCRIYGPFEGVGGIWTIPKNNCEDFESYLKTLIDLDVAEKVEIVWSTCLDSIPVLSRWFNPDTRNWLIDWSGWMREIEDADGELPFTLKEPKDWPIKADEIDLLIIKELEKNGRASLSDISKILGISRSIIKYHYQNHIIKNRLIEGYQIVIHRFLFPVSEALFFKFEFSDDIKTKKFALSLLDKPFVTIIGKVLNENSIITHLILPKWEFRRFIKLLSTLINRDIIRNYIYYIQDIWQTWRATIPYEYFKNGKWIYNNEFYLERVRKMKFP